VNESDHSQNALCLDLVSTRDRDRYLTAMTAPHAAQRHLLAVCAFNAEVAQICESVSESILGEIRFQWWRDQVSGAFGTEPAPAGIAGALHDTIRQNDLSQHLFDRLLNSRQRDLDQTPPQTLNDLLDYCEGTASTLVELSIEILSGQKREAAGVSDLARHTGIAWALCGLIRAIPWDTAHNRCHIPSKLLQDVEALAMTVNEHLIQARHLAKDIPPHTIASVLTIPMTQHYLTVLRKAAFDPYDARVQQSHSVGKTLRLMWANWRKQV
jgi:NADH dehydrogenase [ubiquinone] 1 alpha subcomplex assembly factor 6